MKHPHSPLSSSPSLTPLDYAYRLLARRAYAEQELANKMTAKGFTEAAVLRVVARLKEQGYLNDTQLAADQAERLRQRHFGSERIRAKLKQKSLDPHLVDSVLASSGQKQESEAAQRFLASRFSSDALKQPKVAAKAARLLLSRGYSPDVVEQLLESGLDCDWHTEEK